MMTKFNEYWDNITQLSKDLYDIDVGKNARFVAENIFLASSYQTSFIYVECGVYRGTTFLPIYHFMSKLLENFSAYAIDSFEGFPSDTVSHPNDRFDRFEFLYNEGRIDKNHLMLARNRQEKLLDNEHLSKSYFHDYKSLFLSRCKDKPEISVIETPFDSLSFNFTDPPKQCDLVFLDCDLYLSYKQCLGFLKTRPVFLSLMSILA